MDISKLTSLIEGSIPQEEKGELLKLISSDEDTKSLYIELKNIYSLTQQREGRVDADHEYRLIQKRMKKINPELIIRRFAKYAALLIVGFGLAWFSFNISGRQKSFSYKVKCPPGQFSECLLGDGTSVYLNSNSVLTYTSDFSNKRHVVLEGEALFNVTKDAKKPFVVETVKGMKIRVLGTTFNVSAYSDDSQITTTLIEGKVEILNKEDWVMATLKPNESALFFPEGNELKIEKSNTLIYTSWQDGKIYFKNEPLLDIARRMERWYNVSIVIEDKALEQVPFTLTVLKNKPLNQILEALKLTYPISYSIEEKLGEKNIIKLKKEMPMGK